jgi:hypothetical protein
MIDEGSKRASVDEVNTRALYLYLSDCRKKRCEEIVSNMLNGS